MSDPNSTTASEDEKIARSSAEIEQSREAIGESIRALGEKLEPDRVKDVLREKAREATNLASEVANEKLGELKDAAADRIRHVKDATVETLSETYEEAKDTAVQASRVTVDFVSRNAIPLALLGVGATWLWAQNRGGRVNGNGNGNGRWNGSGRRQAEEGSVSGTARAWKTGAERMGHEVSDGVAHVGQRAREQVERAEHALSSAGTRVRDFAQHEIEQVRTQSQNLLESNPLLVGTLALAAGMGVGMLLPHTKQEDRAFGKMRDHLLEGARETVDELKHAATETVQGVGATLTGQDQTTSRGP